MKVSKKNLIEFLIYEIVFEFLNFLIDQALIKKTQF